MSRLPASLFAALLVLAAGGYATMASGAGTAPQHSQIGKPLPGSRGSYRNGDQLTVDATVIRILPDDRDGSRHQRFIIRVDSGKTLLIAHNIDLAPRLQGLKAGDAVRIAGEYEWNPQGGLLHWTHHDPAGRHQPGYIQWKGRRYE